MGRGGVVFFKVSLELDDLNKVLLNCVASPS